MATRRPFDLPYMVEQWDDADSQVEELALTVITGLRGRHMRKRSSAGRIVTLTQKTRLLADSRKKN
jgi:hypothetical protein